MAATVGSISIDLSTNAAKFASGFKSAASTVESQSARMAKSVAAVETGVNKIGGTLKTFLGGLAAGAGLAGLASLGGAFDKLKETISQFDEIATNANTVGLKTDTYQALAFSAKQANISQESFNAALSIFAKNAGLAEKGTGALFAGLKQLNPALLQSILNTQDQEERLKLVSDALANTTDATQKAALAAVVFGKGGVEMSRFLDQGRASIEAMKKSARDMGLIIPDELLKKGGKLDDQLDVLSTVISVQLSQALIKLAPLLIGATTGFAEFSKEINTSAGAIDNFINNPNLQNFGKIVGPGLLNDAAQGISKALDGASGSADGAAAKIQADILETEKILADLQAQARVGIDVESQTQRAQDDLEFLKKKLAEVQAAGVTAANEIRAAFAQSFRESENASMTALANYYNNQPLPMVTHYGGQNGTTTGNIIDRTPRAEFTTENGVGVRRYGGPASDPANFPASLVDDTGQTADNTKSTADNINHLNQSTSGYFRDLGNTVENGAVTVSHSVSTLADLIGNEFGQLPSYLIAALSQNGSAITTGQGPEHLFGPNYDPQHGSYTMIQTARSIGHYHLPSYADDGSSNVSATVQQPGTNYTLNYTAAPGDSIETTKQKARAAFYAMVNAAESA
jgi:hypothetical protein